MLIVITILGVLAGIVVYAIIGLTEHSRQVSCRTDLREINDAVTAYIAQQHELPPDLEGSLVPYLNDTPSYDGYGLVMNEQGHVTTTPGSVC